MAKMDRNSLTNDTLRKPRAIMVPFGFPDYPMNYLKRFTKESVEVVKKLGIDLTTTRIVVTLDDVQQALDELRKTDFDFIVLLLLSWVEAPNVVACLRDYFHKPILFWSHTMFKEKGELLFLGPLAGAGVVRETLEEMGARFKFIYGMPEEEKVQSQFKQFSRVGYAISALSKARLGLLGYASMGMYTGTFDHVNVRKKIGPEVDQLDQYVLIKKIEELSNDKVSELVKVAKHEWELMEDVRDEDIVITMKQYKVLKELAVQFKWDALSIKCQYELSKYYKATPCVALSMLADDITCSCEGDIPLLVTQMMMHYLSGDTVAYADIHHITDKSILLGCCGFAPLSMLLGKPKVSKHTALYSGLLNSTNFKEGKVTLARLASDKGEGYKMHIVTGAAHIPERYREVGCQPYPAMDVVIDGSTDDFAKYLMSQHYAVIYGDIKEELLELCDLLNVRAVTL
jgi:L-fucose isomerase-like protein